MSYLHALALTVCSTESCLKSGLIRGQFDARYGAGKHFRFRKRQKDNPVISDFNQLLLFSNLLRPP